MVVDLQELPEKLGNCGQLTFLDASGNVFEEYDLLFDCWRLRYRGENYVVGGAVLLHVSLVAASIAVCATDCVIDYTVTYPLQLWLSSLGASCPDVSTCGIDMMYHRYFRLPDGLCRMTMLQELIANTAFLTALPQNIGR